MCHALFVRVDWIVTNIRLSNKPLERPGTSARADTAPAGAGRPAPSR